MTTSPIHLVVGDTRPIIYVQLRQPDFEVDISKATVVMRFKPWRDPTVLFTVFGELLAGTLQADLISPDMSQFPVAGSGGRVRFQFIQGMLDLPPGRYTGEIEFDFGGGTIFTPYTRLQFLLREDYD